MSSETSTVGGIQGFLLKLHSFLSDTETRNAALICHDIIGDLGQECMITKNENDLGKKSSMHDVFKYYVYASWLCLVLLHACMHIVAKLDVCCR